MYFHDTTYHTISPQVLFLSDVVNLDADGNSNTTLTTTSAQKKTLTTSLPMV